jgi:NarL family two-component system response regulator LiaR
MPERPTMAVVPPPGGEATDKLPPHIAPTVQTATGRESVVRNTTRVLLVDDHSVVRTGVLFSLLAFTDIEVVGQAGSGEEALDLCASVLPDVVLMDLQLPGMSGVVAIGELHAAWPATQVLVLTSFPDGDLVERALQAGAIGYLLKDVAVDELARAIRLAHRGVPVLAPVAAQALVHSVARRPPPIGHDLTEREHEVLRLLAAGRSNQQIAEQLVITPATVKFHTRSIRSKLGTSSRTETVVLALHHHLVSDSVQE